MSSPFEESQEQELLFVIRHHAAPLEPLPTGVEPQLQRLDGVRAVLFDVYGTLIVSGSGDVGTTDVDSRPAAFGEALAAVGVEFRGESSDGVQLLSRRIDAHHSRDRAAGINHPEVDIRDIWHDVIVRLQSQRRIAPRESVADVTRLALEYEVRANPTWAMPCAAEVIDALRESRVALGIVSNAQVFTRLLFPVLLGRSLGDLGFDESLCVWSYEHRQAKPGTFLYVCARDELQQRGIAAREVLFVGNDMLKDIWPASRVGFRTALFAGDRRSYRPREDDECVNDVRPDLVLTSLAQLPGCVVPG